MASFRGIPPRERGRYPLRRDVFDADRLPAGRQDIFRAVERRIAEPFRGITTDGTLVPGLHVLAEAPRSDTEPAVAAGLSYLRTLSAAQRAAGQLPMDSPAWRWWTNAFPTWTPHGLLIDDLDDAQRSAALRLMAACLSESGCRKVRTTMLLNELLGELIEDYPQTLREFMYRLTVFGQPATDGAWGWQLAGHHLDVHCALIAGRVVLTPVFMGAEPTVVDTGPQAGLRMFAEEADAGRELMASLGAAQRDSALLFPSMETARLPAHLNHPTEGRMRSAAGGDNLVIPCEGLAARDMDATAQGLLTDLIGLYTSIQPDKGSEGRLREAERHLPDTHFCWVGGWGTAEAFYYRIHSPVILIELDHHRGVFLANEEPTPFHVHTIVRTPNGNDYGRDFLRQHRLAKRR